MNDKSDPAWAIKLLLQALLEDDSPYARTVAAQGLLNIGQLNENVIGALNHVAANDPDEFVRASILQAIGKYYTPQPFSMSDPPKIQMNFNAPVYGAAGNIEGNQDINVPEQTFDEKLREEP